jgi:hypothetical protein
MSMNSANARSELAVGGPTESELLWPVSLQYPDREVPDDIADADRMTMERLFRDALRSRPLRQEL